MLKRVFNFYINSSVHVALAVYALAWITLLEFNLNYDENILYFIFYGSITGYNFVKYYGIAKWHFRSLTPWLNTIQLFSAVCFLLFVYYGLQLQVKTLLVSFVLGVITFLYAIPVFSKYFKLKTLRQVSGLKVYVIAFVWSGVSVFLPLINAECSIGFDAFVTAVQRFVFVLALMVPFEIRDLQFDNAMLGTIPQKIGVKQTKQLGILLLVLFFLLEFFKDLTNYEYVLVLLIISLLTAFLILFSEEKQSKYFASFWVEGVPILWLLIKVVSQVFLNL